VVELGLKGVNQRIKLFCVFYPNMTQITNVLYIVIITLALSVVATLLTVMLDRSFDIPGLMKEIPHLIIIQILQV
jgi:hypothetical protein